MRLAGSIVAVTLLLLAATSAEAAWNPNVTSYTGALSTVRSNMSAYWGSGAQASTIPSRAQRYLRKADAKLSRAQTSLGSNPGWAEISSSLRALAQAVGYIEKAGRRAADVSAFQTFLYDASAGILPALYGESRKMAVSASTYVVDNGSGRRAARKLLKAGAHTTKAQRLAGLTPPKFGRAVGRNRDAIRVLGRSGLL